MDQIEQICRAHASARPKPSNLAWSNCHHDCGVLLAEIERLHDAIRLDIQDAKATCGGDGLGCKAFRPYFDDVERRYRKCGQCPMEALSNVREVMT